MLCNSPPLLLNYVFTTFVFFCVKFLLMCTKRHNNFMLQLRKVFQWHFSAHPPSWQKKWYIYISFLVVAAFVSAECIESWNGDVGLFRWKIDTGFKQSKCAWHEKMWLYALRVFWQEHFSLPPSLPFIPLEHSDIMRPHKIQKIYFFGGHKNSPNSSLWM